MVIFHILIKMTFICFVHIIKKYVKVNDPGPEVRRHQRWCLGFYISIGLCDFLCFNSGANNQFEWMVGEAIGGYPSFPKNSIIPKSINALVIIAKKVL